MKRMELINTLSELVPEELDKIILILKPPAGVIPHFPAPQIQRVSKLVGWAESPTGCGIDKVQEVLRSIALPPEPDTPDPISSPPLTPIDGDLKPITKEVPQLDPDPPIRIWMSTYILTHLKKFLNIKTVLLVVLTLLGVSLPIALYITITPTPACELKPEDEWLSCGEKPITNLDEDDKEKGMMAYTRKDYDGAVSFFDNAWENTKDAETLIYSNNAKLYSKLEGVSKDKIFTIAVVIPHDTSENKQNTKYLSKNILEGVAQKQKEFNNDHYDWKLQILIANDGNDIEQGKQVANQLVKRDIVAVMGHYSSRVTMSVKSIYEDHKIVLLSASSASSNLTNRGDDTFFFRLINTTEYQSQVLAEYLKNKGYKKLALFAIHGRKENLGVSVAFHSDFKDQWSSFGSEYQIVYDADLAPKDSDTTDQEVAEQLKEVNQKQAEAIVLCPDVKEEIILRAKEIIAKNQNNLLITGCSTLNHKYYSDIKPLYYHQLIISAWDDSENFIKEYRKLWPTGYADKYDVSRYALSSDAIKVLIDAIKPFLNKGIKPSSSDLQKILTDPTFETEGLKEKISFRGSERAEKIMKIVKPNCPDTNSNDGCSWREVKPSLSQGQH